MRDLRDTVFCKNNPHSACMGYVASESVLHGGMLRCQRETSPAESVSQRHSVCGTTRMSSFIVFKS